MQALIQLLDTNLEYMNHEVTEDIIKIYVTSTRESVLCPCCNTPSSKVHLDFYRMRCQVELLAIIKSKKFNIIVGMLLVNRLHH